jgi:hypothetical protein
MHASSWENNNEPKKNLSKACNFFPLFATDLDKNNNDDMPQISQYTKQ